MNIDELKLFKEDMERRIFDAVSTELGIFQEETGVSPSAISIGIVERVRLGDDNRAVVDRVVVDITI